MKSLTIMIDTSFECAGMNSSQPRFTHKICAAPMVRFAVDLARAVGETRPVFLHDESQTAEIQACFSDGEIKPVRFPEERDKLNEFLSDGEEWVLILPDNMPLLTEKTVRGFVSDVRKSGAEAATLGNGAYCLRGSLFVRLLAEGKSLAEVGTFCRETRQVPLDEPDGITIKTRVDLARAEEILRRRIAEKLMLSGVTLIDPNNVYIGADVHIEPDCVVYPGNVLEGKTVIGKNTILYPNNHLTDCVIGENCSLRGVVADRATAEDGVRLGPYVHLRPNSVLRFGSFAGAFVEMKNADFGAGSKCAHLAYVGDADVGARCNIGCGVVFVNYDGKHKHRTKVGDHAFIGSNSNLVAPVTVGDGAFVAAGSTVTEDVPGDALCIARSRQTVKPGWVSKKGQW
ncbi:MAG: hypothetical protein KIG36_01235 [Eubacteriales bacterium]|nr:hypothetical protein [Eubacteriales bacterium]